MKIANMSIGFSSGGKYECKFDWPEDCFVQAGDNGLVLGKKPYNTAFFEAFPTTPLSTFIRGEGVTVELAEKKAWDFWRNTLDCSHEWERRGYKNGLGWCKHCNVSKSKCFEPDEYCVSCGKATYYSTDVDNKFWCEDCVKFRPKEKESKTNIMMRLMEAIPKDKL